jgi:diguanylate cyclase (GGDEF)-like protein
MATDLYSENQQLRRQVKAFLTQARNNEQKMRRFQEQELRLISLNSLVDLINTILYEYRASFDLDYVTLTLIDPSYEIQHILEDDGIVLSEHPDLIFTLCDEELDGFYGITDTPQLGSYEPAHHEFLFPRQASKPVSIALLPLVRYGSLIGSLNLGSAKMERFVNGSATDFLQRLSAVVAICLENAANHERLKRVGLTDFLTGVNNRRFFDQRLVEELTRSQRCGEPLSCLLLDIDNFKRINDTHGHRSGDLALKAVAALIRQQLRCSDVLARFGGEEFSVLLINSDQAIGCEIAERIRQELELLKIGLDNGETLQLTVSIGFSIFEAPQPGEGFSKAEGTMTTLVDQADQALYKAKHSGKNRVVRFDEV